MFFSIQIKRLVMKKNNHPKKKKDIQEYERKESKSVAPTKQTDDPGVKHNNESSKEGRREQITNSEGDTIKPYLNDQDDPKPMK